MQLDSDEVQTAVIEYLRRRGTVIEDNTRVRMEIVDRSGARMDIVGCSAVAFAYNVKLPEGPYR